MGLLESEIEMRTQTPVVADCGQMKRGKFGESGISKTCGQFEGGKRGETEMPGGETEMREERLKHVLTEGGGGGNSAGGDVSCVSEEGGGERGCTEGYNTPLFDFLSRSPSDSSCTQLPHHFSEIVLNGTIGPLGYAYHEVEEKELSWVDLLFCGSLHVSFSFVL